ncbi:MAG: heme o synthase [Sporolactobacillus sp.]
MINKTIVSGQITGGTDKPAAQMASGPTVKDVFTTIKMGIIVSNLITAFAGAWLALYFTDRSATANLLQLILVLAGSALVIGGGCALNNYIDRDIDPIMERTHERPSATGKLTGKTVLTIGFTLAAAGLVLLFAASSSAAIFGLVGLFTYVLIYTMWLKRAHTINTIVGSIAGAVPPLIGWAAIDPSLNSPIPWILFLILFLWQPPHFLALAIKRVEEYRRAGIPMLPVVAGFAITKRQMIIYVAALLPVSLLLYSLGIIYLIVALLLGGGWLGYAVYGLFTKDTTAWSRVMFVLSLNYMTVLFAAMIASTLI